MKIYKLRTSKNCMICHGKNKAISNDRNKFYDRLTELSEQYGSVVKNGCMCKNCAENLMKWIKEAEEKRNRNLK